MTKLVKKFQGGGTADETYRASYSLPEIKVIDKQPEWFKYLNDYDKARLKSGQINTETAKSIAQERATGTSQYTQDVNKLSWIPNGAMAVAGGMSLIGNPVAADVLGNAVLATDIVEAADRKGIKQAIKENAPYLVTAGLFTPVSNGFKIIKGGFKGARDARVAIKGVKETTKNPERNLIQRVFTKEVSPATKQAQVYNPNTQSWENLPKGTSVSEPYKEEVKVVKENNGLYKIEGEKGTSKYTSEAINRINNSRPQYVNIIAPDKTLYGKYLKSAYTEVTIPAEYKLRNWVYGLPIAGSLIYGYNKSTGQKNSSQQNIQSNNYHQKSSLSQTDPDLFD